MRRFAIKYFNSSILALTLSFASGAYSQDTTGTTSNQSSPESISSNIKSHQNDIAVTTTSEFVNYFKNCDQLTDKGIIFQRNKSAGIRISASTSAFCHIESFKNDNQTRKKIASCDISKTDVDDLTSPNSLELIRQFELSGKDNAEVSNLFKKLTDCFSESTKTESNPTQPPSNNTSQQSKPDSSPDMHDYGKLLQ